MIDKQSCCERVYGDGRGFTGGVCGNRAKFHEGGKWYCGIHAPSKVAHKQSVREAKWVKERELSDAKYAMDAAGREFLDECYKHQYDRTLEAIYCTTRNRYETLKEQHHA